MFSREFWVDVFERTIRTAAQAAIGAIGSTALVTTVKWDIVGYTSALAAVVTILMALAAPRKESGSASFRDDAA